MHHFRTYMQHYVHIYINLQHSGNTCILYIDACNTNKNAINANKRVRGGGIRPRAPASWPHAWHSLLFNEARSLRLWPFQFGSSCALFTWNISLHAADRNLQWGRNSGRQSVQRKIRPPSASPLPAEPNRSQFPMIPGATSRCSGQNAALQNWHVTSSFARSRHLPQRTTPQPAMEQRCTASESLTESQ